MLRQYSASASAAAESARAPSAAAFSSAAPGAAGGGAAGAAGGGGASVGVPLSASILRCHSSTSSSAGGSLSLGPAISASIGACGATSFGGERILHRRDLERLTHATGRRLRERGEPLAHRSERRAAVVVIVRHLRMRGLRCAVHAGEELFTLVATLHSQRHTSGKHGALMRRAIVLAREAEAAGGEPYGALIADASGAIVAEGRNHASNNPLWHVRGASIANLSRA